MAAPIGAPPRPPPIGMVDNKVCAIDATWSGVRLVLRKELRPGRTTAAG